MRFSKEKKKICVQKLKQIFESRDFVLAFYAI